MCLARAERNAQRFYSLSSQIRKERSEYYRALEDTQKGSLDITPWMEWFLGCTARAIESSQSTLAAVFAKAEFWIRFASVHINERQRKMLNRLFDGFEGKLTTDKWMKMTGAPNAPPGATSTTSSKKAPSSKTRRAAAAPATASPK